MRSQTVQFRLISTAQPCHDGYPWSKHACYTAAWYGVRSTGKHETVQGQQWREEAVVVHPAVVSFGSVLIQSYEMRSSRLKELGRSEQDELCVRANE